MVLDNFYDSFVLFHNKFYEFFLDKENPYINNGLSKEKLFMLNDFIMNYFIFIENMKLPLLNNMQYFTMNTNLQSELLQLQEYLSQLQTDKQNELYLTYNSIKNIDNSKTDNNNSLTALLNAPSFLKFNKSSSKIRNKTNKKKKILNT